MWGGGKRRKKKKKDCIEWCPEQRFPSGTTSRLSWQAGPFFRGLLLSLTALIKQAAGSQTMAGRRGKAGMKGCFCLEASNSSARARRAAWFHSAANGHSWHLSITFHPRIWGSCSSPVPATSFLCILWDPALPSLFQEPPSPPRRRSQVRFFSPSRSSPGFAVEKCLGEAARWF